MVPLSICCWGGEMDCTLTSSRYPPPENICSFNVAEPPVPTNWTVWKVKSANPLLVMVGARATLFNNTSI